MIYIFRPGANITADPASASESCGQVYPKRRKLWQQVEEESLQQRKKKKQ